MININTMTLLNNIAFGADIDSLESYIIDFKQAQLLARLDKYEAEYLKLSKILKELKTESLAFSDKTSLTELDTNNYDRIFLSKPNFKMKLAYGTQSDTLCNIKNNIYENKDTFDIMAMTYIEGININCIYIKGNLFTINAIGEYYKYIDLTSVLKSKVPEHIKELAKYELVELRGKITIFKDEEYRLKRLNTICSTMEALRLNINIDKLNIIFDDMFIEDNTELPFDNQWDKIEFMSDIGLVVPHHALVRGIDKETFNQAMEELDNYFDDIQNDTDIVYDYNNIEIRLNDDIYCSDDNKKFIYNSRDCDSKQLYSSKIKSISTTSNGNTIKPVLNIVSIQCNDKLDIDNIVVDDICTLETNDLKIGSKVVFNVINNKAYIVKNK